MIETRTLINNLVDIAWDYQNCNFDNQHVKHWLEQFPESWHQTLLSELNFILDKTYISEAKTKNFINQIIRNRSALPQPIDNYTFLHIQTVGRSQSDLLDILLEETNYEINLVNLEDGTIYEGSLVYIDDVFYTGKRLYDDIKNWIDTMSEDNDITNIEELIIIYYFTHTSNLDYQKKRIQSLLPHTTITFLTHTFLKNDIKNLAEYDAFLPSDEYEFCAKAEEFITNLDRQRSEAQRQYIPLLRPYNLGNNIQYINNHEDRKILEHIFFESGVEILQEAVNPSFKPMGYDYNKTLGFGSLVVTYRNSPNNGPLVFWWGNTQLDNWYPLFPRIVY